MTQFERPQSYKQQVFLLQIAVPPNDTAEDFYFTHFSLIRDLSSTFFHKDFNRVQIFQFHQYASLYREIVINRVTAKKSG